MIKLLLLLLMALPVFGVSKLEDAKIFSGIHYDGNYVINPSARFNAYNVTVSSAAITRDTTAGNKIEDVASFICDASALNGYCEWALNAPTNEDASTNKTCEFNLHYKGDGTLYKLQILDGSSNVLATSDALASVSVYTKVQVWYICGSSRAIRLTQATAGTAPAVNVGRVFYGPSPSIATGYVVDPNFAFTSKAANYTATSTDGTIVFTVSSTLGLPAASSVPGKKYEIVGTTTNVVITIDPSGSETVCAQTTIKVDGPDAVEIQSDGTNWVGLKDSCWRERTALVGTVCTSNPCTITTQFGRASFTSVNWTSTGLYSAAIPAGIYSTAPICQVMSMQSGTNYTECQSYSFTTTSFSFQCNDNTSTLRNVNFTITCQGPR